MNTVPRSQGHRCRPNLVIQAFSGASRCLCVGGSIVGVYLSRFFEAASKLGSRGHRRYSTRAAVDLAVRPLSLYLDTSVIGGYFDPEFMADTRALWRLMEAGRFRFVTSQVVIEEVLGAPPEVRELMYRYFPMKDVLARSEATARLAQAYLARKVVPPDCSNDAWHVAMCSASRLDCLVSWNFKHLTNVRREAGFNEVNRLQGYPPMRIVAPTFLIHGQEEKGF